MLTSEDSIIGTVFIFVIGILIGMCIQYWREARSPKENPMLENRALFDDIENHLAEMADDWRRGLITEDDEDDQGGRLAKNNAELLWKLQGAQRTWFR